VCVYRRVIRFSNCYVLLSNIIPHELWIIICSERVYTQIANVVAKLEPADPTLRTNSSVLLNCHFDSKPGSPGATDNVISCSVMLEVLRVLSMQPELVVRNTIVFLFNGAEELGLQGAHGFVRGRESQSDTELGHPWSTNVKVFVNLEGAGAGGREILFQATGGLYVVFCAVGQIKPDC